MTSAALVVPEQQVPFYLRVSTLHRVPSGRSSRTYAQRCQPLADLVGEREVLLLAKPAAKLDQELIRGAVRPSPPTSRPGLAA